MKLKKTLLSLVGLGLLFSSCDTSDSMKVVGDGSGVILETTIEGSSTEATPAKSGWGRGDAMGVFMLKTGSRIVMDNGENVKYTTPADGRFSWATKNDKLVLPVYGDAVDIIAYFPYDASKDAVKNTKHKIDVTNQTNQKALNFLYSNSIKNINAEGGSILQMGVKQQLSKITFNVKSADYDLTGISAIIHGTNTKAEFDLLDQSFTQTGDPEKIELQVEAKNKNNAIARGIIIPNQNKGRYIEFKLTDGSIEIVTIGDDVVFEPGKQYEYPIDLEKGKDNSILGKGQIQDWIEVDGGDIIIESDGTTLIGDGTENNPYSIAGALSKTSESAVWIEGYVIESSQASYSNTYYLGDRYSEYNKEYLITVDITGSPVANEIDANKHSELIGKRIKLKADIATTAGAITMSNITAHVGGVEATVEKETYFLETMQSGAIGVNKDVSKFTGYDNYGVMTYTGNTEIRERVEFFPNHVWFAASGVGSTDVRNFKIEGIPSNYDNVKLSYEIAPHIFSDAEVAYLNDIKVLADGKEISIPNVEFKYEDEYNNHYYIATVDIPTGFTSLEFVGDEANKTGFRLGDIKLEGIKR